MAKAIDALNSFFISRSQNNSLFTAPRASKFAHAHRTTVILQIKCNSDNIYTTENAFCQLAHLLGYLRGKQVNLANDLAGRAVHLPLRDNGSTSTTLPTTGSRRMCSCKQSSLTFSGGFII